MYDYNRVLPIGTVVLLQNAEKRLMIVGYQRKKAQDDGKVYDYCGCLYPEGFMTPAESAVFDHSQIDRIIYMGFQNPIQAQFAERLRAVLRNHESDR